MLAALCFLNRPLLGILIPTFLFSLLNKNDLISLSGLKLLINKYSVLILGFMLTISPWIIRNYVVTNGEIVIAEKYYYNSPMQYGEASLELRYLISGYTNPANLNLSSDQLCSQLSNNAYLNKTNENVNVITPFISQLPKEAFQGYSPAELERTIYTLADCYQEKANFHTKLPNAGLKEILIRECEKNTAKQFKQMRQKFVENAPFTYFILTPITTIKGLIFQSNSSNLSMFNRIDNSFRWWQIIPKGFMYIFNVLLFSATIFFLLFPSKNIELKKIIAPYILALFISLSAFLFRYVESRYMISIYPLLSITLAYWISKIKYIKYPV